MKKMAKSAIFCNLIGLFFQFGLTVDGNGVIILIGDIWNINFNKISPTKKFKKNIL